MSRAPRQFRLPLQSVPASKSRHSGKSKADAFDISNAQAAEIILNDPKRAAEGEALMTRWALLFRARHHCACARADVASISSGGSKENFLSRHKNSSVVGVDGW